MQILKEAHAQVIEFDSLDEFKEQEVEKRKEGFMCFEGAYFTGHDGKLMARFEKIKIHKRRGVINRPD